MGWQTIAYIVIRLLIPVTILRWRIGGVILSEIADTFDYNALSLPPIGPHNYQYLDKFLDTYYLAFMAYVVLQWKDVAAKKVAWALFMFRVVGVILFLSLRAEYVLLFFPNVFESFYLVVALHQRITKATRFLRLHWQLAVALIILLIPKIINEYYLHAYHVASAQLPTFLTWVMQHVPQGLKALFALPGYITTPMYWIPPGIVLGWAVYATLAARRVDGVEVA